MTTAGASIRLLWFTPDKPENISVGRQRVSHHLSEHGFDVTLRGTNRETVVKSLRERDEYDVVLGTTRAGAIAATVHGRLSRCPVFVDHIDPISQQYETSSRWVASIVKRLENVAFRLSAHTFYVYDQERARVATRARSCSQTNLGVEYHLFAHPEQSVLDEAADRLSTLNLEANVVTYVGGLEPMYNISTLLDAMDHLSGWSAVIAGAGSLEHEVKRRANNRDDITFLGVLSHDSVPGYLHQADVGVSLVDDAHTLKVLEYLAASLPVVQVDGEARERFGDRLNYCSLAAEEVAGAIERAKGQQIGADTHEFVRRFSWASIAEDYERVLRSVVSGS